MYLTHEGGYVTDEGIGIEGGYVDVPKNIDEFLAKWAAAVLAQDDLAEMRRDLEAVAAVKAA